MTLRKNGKWVKTTKTSKGWTVAMGWKGNFKAVTISHCGTNRTLAAVTSLNWIKS